MKLVAVVTTHNRLKELRLTLERLLAVSKDSLAAVVVVNNCSSDGTEAFLNAEQDARLRVHNSKDNLGGAGGFEVGMRLAVEEYDPDWVVVMDDDARPYEGAFEQFVNQSRDKASGGADVWAAAVYYPDGEICEMNRPSVNPFWKPKVFMKTLFGAGRDGYHIEPSTYDGVEPQPLDMSSFVGMFISRGVIDEMGYPEGALFLYGDDVIYSLRLRRRGFTMLFDPQVRFEHNCTTFSNDNKGVYSPLWKVYYNYRNGLIMYRNASGIMFWPLLALLVPKWLLAARRYGADRKTYMKLTRRAIVDGVLGRKTLTHDAVLALAEKD